MGEAVPIDTLAYAKRLIQAGMPQQQAEVQAQILKEIIDTNLATKRDIAEVKADMERVKADLEKAKVELKALCVRPGLTSTSQPSHSSSLLAHTSPSCVKVKEKRAKGIICLSRISSLLT